MGGLSADNLALCCIRYNLWKGTDLGSLSAGTGRLVPLLNQRRERWTVHVRLAGPVIEPLTDQTKVTARVLRIDDEKRVAERCLVLAIGR
jgi:hypothetical protein